MKTNNDETTLVVKQDRSPEFKAQILKECAEPGAIVRRVAIAHQLEPSLVYRWQKESKGKKAQRAEKRKMLQLTGPTNQNTTTNQTENSNEETINSLHQKINDLTYQVATLTNALTEARAELGSLYIRTRKAA